MLDILIRRKPVTYKTLVQYIMYLTKIYYYRPLIKRSLYDWETVAYLLLIKLPEGLRITCLFPLSITRLVSKGSDINHHVT